MLVTIAVSLIVLWLLGLVSSYTIGGLISFGRRRRGALDSCDSRPSNHVAVLKVAAKSDAKREDRIS